MDDFEASMQFNVKTVTGFKTYQVLFPELAHDGIQTDSNQEIAVLTRLDRNA